MFKYMYFHLNLANERVAVQVAELGDFIVKGRIIIHLTSLILRHVGYLVFV